MTQPERTDTAFLALERAHKDACSHNHIYGACLGPTRRLALGKQCSLGFDFQKVVKLARFRDHSETLSSLSEVPTWQGARGVSGMTGTSDKRAMNLTAAYGD
jgi:hypothetical protein